MKLYEVIPIAKGIGRDTLSYFGKDDIELGSLVTIPLRKKNSYAIVIQKSEIGKEKSQLKSSSFALKKIGAIISPHFISGNFLKAAETTAKYFAATTGSVLQSLLPSLVLEEKRKKTVTKNGAKSEIRKEHVVLQSDDEERIATYRSFIRGEFARDSSVYFCLPTIEDIRFMKTRLEKGIEQYIAVLHSKLSTKEFAKQLEIIEETAHPILILTTVPFLSVERKDAKSIVLDRENSRGYRTQTRPYFDMRVFVENLAKISNKKLILGDMMLSTETLFRLKNEEFAEFSPLKSRLISTAQSLLIDMKEVKGKEDFRILSKELEALIDKTKEENERLFIFAARKGLSPTTVCGDCGQVVVCDNCRAPIVLYTRGGKNIFKCNKCGEERDTMERCNNCQSWKLETLGIGIERVEEEIKKKFPNIKIFRMDKESVKTEKKALDMTRKFEDSPGSVMIGTELALFYLKNNIENVAVASIDSLFSIPDFRINEKMFYVLLTMRSRAQKVFIIQTRNAGGTVFDYVMKGNLTDFYREEIEDRKIFSYPPFSVFIKLSIEGRRPKVDTEANKIAELFKKYNPSIFPGFSPTKKGNVVMNILIRVASKDWPNEEMLRVISTLPPHVAVRIDPESLL